MGMAIDRMGRGTDKGMGIGMGMRMRRRLGLGGRETKCLAM